jgi:hypothetical protein
LLKIALITLAVFAHSAFAEEAIVSPTQATQIDWASLDGQSVHIQADDPAIQVELEKHFPQKNIADAETPLQLQAKSFYRLVFEHQQGYPGKIMPVSDVLAGQEPSRFKLNFLACGKQDNTIGKHEAWNVGMSSGVSAASAIAPGIGNSGLAGVGLLVGLVSAIFTSGETELSCTETKTVCPFSASWCEWKESVITQFTLIQNDTTIGTATKITDRVGYGFKPKEIAEKHLVELAEQITTER